MTRHSLETPSLETPSPEALAHDLFGNSASWSEDDLEQILRALDEEGTLSGSPTLRRAGVAEARVSARPTGVECKGVWIDHYRILARLDRGGMGEVFLAARQYDGFQTRHALKVLNPACRRNQDMRSLFGKEMKLLAALDHPNIARFQDAGETVNGEPYVVMELVEGQRIDRFCAHGDLGVRERIELFRVVCSAVHHAHRNLIVHGDLKPANILVTVDGRATPKLVDFGIAEMVNPVLSCQSFDDPFHRLMTPEYASPEQIRGGLISTATDVYSLGLILYELLTGQRAYTVKGSSHQALQHQISRQTPLPPSQAVRRWGKNPPHSAKASPPLRTTGNPLGLARRLEGDLDCIVLKALEKKPSRRYSSVQALSEDLRRYLEHHPVHARERTLKVRGEKFLKRHPLESAFAAVCGIATLGLLVQTAKGL